MNRFHTSPPYIRIIFWSTLGFLAVFIFWGQQQFAAYQSCLHGSYHNPLCRAEFDTFLLLSKMVYLFGGVSVVVAVSNMLLENRYWKYFLPPALFVLVVSLWVLIAVPQGNYWLAYLLT